MVAEVTELLSYEQLQIDAFTENAFSGNPAAVVFNHGSEGWMQNIATENNLAETSFLDELPGVENGYYLRWSVCHAIIVQFSSLINGCLGLHQIMRWSYVGMQP